MACRTSCSPFISYIAPRPKTDVVVWMLHFFVFHSHLLPWITIHSHLSIVAPEAPHKCQNAHQLLGQQNKISESVWSEVLMASYPKLPAALLPLAASDCNGNTENQEKLAFECPWQSLCDAEKLRNTQCC